MADIIDLDFYRKFRVVLPVYLPHLEETPLGGDSKSTVKPCRRRRKINPGFSAKTEIQEKEDSV